MQMRKSTHLWREEDHPRDEDGKFCKNNHLGNKAVDKPQKSAIIKDNSSTLTKQEWAIWYEKIGEIKRGYYCKKTSTGEYLIPVKNKVVFTSGTYENPIAGRIVRFASLLEATVFIEIFEEFEK